MLSEEQRKELNEVANGLAPQTQELLNGISSLNEGMTNIAGNFIYGADIASSAYSGLAPEQMAGAVGLGVNVGQQGESLELSCTTIIKFDNLLLIDHLVQLSSQSLYPLFPILLFA